MSFLQDVINKRVASETVQVQEGRSDTVRSALSKYMDGNSMFSFEGTRGEKHFDDIAKTLGYRNTSDFFSDNSGAYEALIDWIGSQRNAEWVEALSEGGGGFMDDDDEDDEDGGR